LHPLYRSGRTVIEPPPSKALQSHRILGPVRRVDRMHNVDQPVAVPPADPTSVMPRRWTMNRCRANLPVKAGCRVAGHSALRGKNA